MTKLAACAAVAATLLTTSLAHADTGAPGTVAPTASVAPVAEGSPKSEDTAFALSLGGTAASAALTVAGFSTGNGGLALAGLASSLVTPSLGQWYAGQPLTAGMGIRAASAVAFVAGTAEALKCWSYDGTDTGCQSNDTLASVLLIGGLAGYAGGTIYDIATARHAAREYNARHGFTMTLAPTAVRTASGQSTMGVGIGGTF